MPFIKEPIKGRPSEERMKELKRKYIQKSKKVNPLDLMTKLVVAKLSRGIGVEHSQYHLAKLWLDSKKVEYLPNGIPYKLVDDPDICSVGATFVNFFPQIGRLNVPLILVGSMYPNKAMNRNAAMHEFNEWSRQYRLSKEAHIFAQNRENPRLSRLSQIEERKNFRLAMVPESKEDIARNTREYPSTIEKLRKKLARRRFINKFKSLFVRKSP